MVNHVVELWQVKPIGFFFHTRNTPKSKWRDMDVYTGIGFKL